MILITVYWYFSLGLKGSGASQRLREPAPCLVCSAMVSLGRLLGFVVRKRGEIAVSSAYLCMVSTFLAAYLHPSGSALVVVDGFKEASLELALILVSLPAAARFLFSSMARGSHEG